MYFLWPWKSLGMCKLVITAPELWTFLLDFTFSEQIDQFHIIVK